MTKLVMQQAPAPAIPQRFLLTASVWGTVDTARSATPVMLGDGGLDGFLARERAGWAEAVRSSGARPD